MLGPDLSGVDVYRADARGGLDASLTFGLGGRLEPSPLSKDSLKPYENLIETFMKTRSGPITTY